MRYILLALGVMVASSAFAEAGAQRSLKELQALDTDGDSMLSLAEAEQGAPRLASRFNELDTNRNGLLSRDEIAEGHAMHGVRFVRHIQDDFAAADTNTDGKLSEAEAGQAMPIVSDHFLEMDTSADGYVTMEEIHAHAKSHGPILRHVTMDERSVSTQE